MDENENENENEDVLPIPGIFPGLKLVDYEKNKKRSARPETTESEEDLLLALDRLKNFSSSSSLSSSIASSFSVASWSTTIDRSHPNNIDAQHDSNSSLLQITTASAKLQNPTTTKRVKKRRFDVLPSGSNKTLPPSLAEHFVEANCIINSTLRDLDESNSIPVNQIANDKESVGPLHITRTILPFEPSKILPRRFATKSQVNDLRVILLQYSEARILAVRRSMMQDHLLSATGSNQHTGSSSSLSHYEQHKKECFGPLLNGPSSKEVHP